MADALNKMEQGIEAACTGLDQIPDAVNDALEQAKASGEFKGEKGETGAVGETGPPGPQGEKGEKGDTGATGAAGPQGEKGETGATGPQGPQGEKGETGEAGAQGIQGPAGPQGEPGKDGAAGADGFSPSAKVEQTTSGARITVTDKSGTTYADIKHGESGSGGSGGADGKDGVTFTPSVNPDTGVISWTNDGGLTNPAPVDITGPQGPAGVSPKIVVWDLVVGEHTVSITDANGEQSFVVYDGEKGDKGDKGDPGPQGPVGVDGHSTYAYAGDFGVASAASPPDGEGAYPIAWLTTLGDRTLHAGDLAFDTAGNLMRVTAVYLDASAFDAEFVTNIMGPQGAQGDKGDPGAMGPEGPEGPRGINGIDGEDGVSIVSMGQTQAPTEDRGVNEMVVALSNGRTHTFRWLNGGPGSPGEDGKDGKSPIIGSNGNWYVWDAAQGVFVDTGTAAGGSGSGAENNEIYIGSTEPTGSEEVWIDPSGAAATQETWTFTLADGSTVTRKVWVE